VAALAVAAVLGTDLLFTQVYRRFVPPVPARNGLRTPSDLYHHDLRPRVSVEDEVWGPRRSPYRTNSLAFRDRSVREVPLRSGRPRIVFIGDSFTEGAGVAYEASFVGRVDAALAPRGVEVLNAGVISYCPILYYRKVQHLLEDVGLRFDALVVYIDIGDIQDEVTYKLDAEGNVRSRPVRRVQELAADQQHGGRGFYRFPRLKKFLDRNSLLWSHAYVALERLFPMEGNRAGLWTVHDEEFEAYGREGLELARENMDRLADLLRRNGIALTVAVYPWPDQIRHRDLQSKQVTFWSEWAAAHGAGFIDHFPQFIDGLPAADVLDRYFIPGDVHWNEDGHRLIAERFLEHYERRPVGR
jgi:lysophospholipase L1-like esterase